MNIASLAGLNTVRTLVMKEAAGAPTEAQVDAMCRIVDEQMRNGAFGASTGFAYVPGRFATRAEIERQLQVVARYGGVHASHIRDEGSAILASVDEAMAVSRAAAVPLVISHLKVAGRGHCSQYDTLLRRMRGYAAAPGSAGIFVDHYPYDASSTGIDLYLPNWFLAMSRQDRARTLLGSPDRLRADIARAIRRDGFPDLAFARIASFVPQREWQGLTIADIDARIGRRTSTLESQMNVMLDVVNRGGAQMIYHNICSSVLERIHRDLPAMVGTDSAIRYDDGSSLPHPRGWGTFPKYLKTVTRGPDGLRWAEAIRRITDMPAQVFGLGARGRVRTGYSADLVLFDPDTLRDRATFQQPFRRPRGIHYVIVNGRVVLEARMALYEVEAVPTGEFSGKFLRRAPVLRRTEAGLVTMFR